jgi:hypothetical protein
MPTSLGLSRGSSRARRLPVQDSPEGDLLPLAIPTQENDALRGPQGIETFRPGHGLDNRKILFPGNLPGFDNNTQDQSAFPIRHQDNDRRGGWFSSKLFAPQREIAHI